MEHENLAIIGRVAGALVIGALIGFERTFHGRPAGFRTHSLFLHCVRDLDDCNGLSKPMNDLCRA
jgi:MgtC family